MPVYVVMGVSGCGKSAVGRRLAKRLGVPFHDGDDFHPESNRAKMGANVPLTDDDREPWLQLLAERIAEWNQSGGAVLACSALKEAYRRTLRGKAADVTFIHLEGPADLIRQRMAQRKGHYMKAGMLDSQLATLEPPADAIVLNIELPLDALVELIIREIGDKRAEPA